jgi:hypothetical protein
MADLIIPAPDAAGYWHFTYITTDTLDGSWYGGKRSCKKHPSSDPYLGSGNWVRKHPERKRLRREIVAFFATSKEVYAAEADMITWAAVLDDPLCMNETEGGLGMSVECSQRRLACPEFRAKHADAISRVTADPKWREKTAASNRRLANDPKWLEKVAVANRLTSTDPDWRANTAAANRLKADDPAWLDACVEGGLIRSAKPEWRENHAAGMTKRAANGKWIENIAAANRLKAADPKWREANAAQTRRLAVDLKWQEAVTAANRRKAIDPTWLAKVSAAALLREAAKRAAKAAITPPAPERP